MEMGAQEIADIYKRRRQVELFFNMDKTKPKNEPSRGKLEPKVRRGIKPDFRIKYGAFYWNARV
jgi:hypothetical protein